MYYVSGLIPAAGEKQPVRGYYTVDGFNRIRNASSDIGDQTV